NLAPAMAGTDLFTHIRYMVFTTAPTLAITLVIFFAWGFTIDTTGAADTEDVLRSIDSAFNLNPVLFVVPALVLFMIVRKVPAIPALLVGSVLGGIFAIVFQPQIIDQMSQVTGNPIKSAFVAVMKSMATNINIKTDNEMISQLLSSGGMAGMLNTIWLILGAMIFGGVMESSGLLMRIVEEIIKWAHSTGSLVLSTAVTSIFFNCTAGDQYMAIAIPGRMFADTYRKQGYKPELLSRTLEDAGTVTSVLVPWNTCGATQSKVLGISTWTYAPYCFFCIISPCMTVAQAYLNFKIRRLNDKAS
ncbi:MAG: Na+/H+ antiporter NhaC family protein, partial [Cytophagales bacterium]